PDDFLANANLALNKKVTVSGLEVPYAYDETLAVDGKLTTRLSFARDKDEQWMVVDLGEIYNVGRINISFFERVSDYELYASEDGENYKKVAEKHGLPEGVRGESDEIFIEPTGARYIKYVQLKRWYCADYNTYYSGGISEFEVFPAEKDDKALLEKAESIDDENVKKALKAVEKYKKLERKYALHLDSLYNDLENAIADFEGKNSESSEVSEEKKEGGSNTTAYIIAGSTALAICASLIAVKKKKKKEK
ncbi:MAG: discoidin domain-containing protein, partial [Clostridiales bacterium]|nr:discoidin domain-containing protein [Candidatus Coliplasma equi]